MELLQLTKAEFDPDELQLTKSDILRITHMVKTRWRKNKRANWKFLMGMIAFEGGIQLTDEDAIKKVWKDLMHVSNELIVANNMRRLAGEMPSTKAMLDILEAKIERGEIIG